MFGSTPPLRIVVLSLLALSTLFASGAAAEMPQNRDAPTITAALGPVVGQTLIGNNGTWLYVDGSACRDECRYSFAWQRCIPGGECRAIPGSGQRGYRVAPDDIGRMLRVAVTTTKFDCNAHGQDCRDVERTALSAQTPTVQGPVAPTRLTISRIALVHATRGRLVVTLRVTDERGRSVTGALVIVRMGSGSSARTARTGSSGVANVAVRPGSRATTVAFSVRAERGGATPASLEVRLPVMR